MGDKAARGKPLMFENKRLLCSLKYDPLASTQA